METMYREAVSYHIYSLLALVVVITLLYLFTQLNKDVDIYKRRVRVWMPVYITTLASAIFTGLLMAASKHLTLTPSIGLMTALVFFLIFVEIKRNKILKKVSSNNDIGKLDFIKLIYAVELLSIFTVVYLVKAKLL